MKTGTDIRISVQTLLLAVLAVAATVAAVTLYVRSGPQPDQAAADNSAAPASAPASAGYIKIGDIKGESQDADHKDWINLLSVSQSITRPMAAGATGSTRTTSSATFGDIVVVKEVDKSTPKLQETLATGQHIPLVNLDLSSPSADGRTVPYLQYELRNVIVTNYRIGGSVGGSDRPVETISLNFEEIKVTYDEQGKAGASSGKVEYTWKIEEGTK